MSTLRTNALEGMDAKNSITIVAGAGNITTTNVQSGIAKHWMQLNGTGTPAATDSFNLSSITDNQAGDYTYFYTNNFANAGYSAPMGQIVEGLELVNHYSDGETTTAQGRTYTYDVNNSYAIADNGGIHITTHGDLA